MQCAGDSSPAARTLLEPGGVPCYGWPASRRHTWNGDDRWPRLSSASRPWWPAPAPSPRSRLPRGFPLWTWPGRRAAEVVVDREAGQSTSATRRRCSSRTGRRSCASTRRGTGKGRSSTRERGRREDLVGAPADAGELGDVARDADDLPDGRWVREEAPPPLLRPLPDPPVGERGRREDLDRACRRSGLTAALSPWGPSCSCAMAATSRCSTTMAASSAREWGRQWGLQTSRPEPEKARHSEHHGIGYSEP